MVVINRCWLIMWRHQMTYVGAVTSRSPMYRSCSSSCYRKLLRAKPQNFAPTVSISYLLSCATERYRLAVLLYTLTMLLHNLRCATCFSQLHSKCSGQGRNHRWVGGGGGGVRTPNFLEDPQLLTQRFCRGSTVKTAEWIRCMIQKKKGRRNSSCYYCRYYPLFMFSIWPYIWQYEEIFVHKIHTLILYFVCT